MQFQYTPYILPLLIASAISAWIVYYAWRRRAVNHAILLSLLSMAITEWLIFYALQIAGVNLPTKLLFGEMKYIGVAFTPLLWFLFAINYAGSNKTLTWRIVTPLAVVPSLTSILAVTTEWHGLFWSNPQLTFAPNFSDFSVTYGPWYWVHFAYSYLLILAGTIIVFRTIRRSKGLLRRQAVALIVAVLTPWFGNIIYFSGFNPIPYLDLTPFAFTITVFSLTWAILGFRLVDLAPVARDQIVDDMKDGMIVLDAENYIADINFSAERMIGLSASQVIGKPASEALSRWPDLVERYSQSTDVLDEISVGEGAALNWLELQISPLHDRRKNFLGRVIVMRNITTRKEMENALSDALEKAREASRLKSQLLARVSHELRTPLGGILGFAELLHMNSFGALDERQKSATGQIIESATYLDGIINELLDEAQLESDALTLNHAPFSLDGLLQRIKDNMSGRAHEKGLAFNVSLAPDMPKSLYGDERRVEQILTSLLSNAVKFTDHGLVELSVYIPAADKWAIKVSDTGPGIPEDAQSYIFDAFRLVNTAIIHENRGAGLGLSITKQLVKLMGGEIRLKSSPGTGSVFTVTLPLMQK
ncbi:two-component system, sensor histidine kinase [Anaerolineales bacterium]|nr:two-component system, sensor histidine kinase [Anaerolineales bacterium]